MNGMRRRVTRRSVAASSPGAADASTTEMLQRAVAETGPKVIVHHADGLHEGIADGGPDEAEPALLQSFAHGDRFAGARGQVAQGASAVLLGRSTDKAPEKRAERASPGLELEEAAGVRDRGLDLLAVAHDARVLEELSDFLAIVPYHPVGIESLEHLEKSRALVQDDAPGQPSLEAVQD